MKNVMIYGTLGPACADPAILQQMLCAGLTGMRLNLSHVSLEEAEDLLRAYRKTADACGKQPELLIDMQGPELRLGALSEPVLLREGDVIGADTLPFPEMLRDALTEGQEILLDDGKLLLCAETYGLRVLRGGMLSSRKSVALPGVSVQTPALTEADRHNLRVAAQFGVTGVMQPFVRSKEDLLEVRRAMDEAGLEHARLFAKIENAEGVRSLDALIPFCDEIVIARGDLGNAVPLWELPAVQKRIAAACRAANRDFTVVTQMLDSMIRNPVPTRAEVSDVFNAVLDGAASVNK